jgi:hypothetical protein
VVAEAKKHLPPLEHIHGLHQLGLLVFAWFVSGAVQEEQELVEGRWDPEAVAALWHIKIIFQLHQVHLIQ